MPRPRRRTQRPFGLGSHDPAVRRGTRSFADPRSRTCTRSSGRDASLPRVDIRFLFCCQRHPLADGSLLLHCLAVWANCVPVDRLPSCEFLRSLIGHRAPASQAADTAGCNHYAPLPCDRMSSASGPLSLTDRGSRGPLPCCHPRPTLSGQFPRSPGRNHRQPGLAGEDMDIRAVASLEGRTAWLWLGQAVLQPAARQGGGGTGFPVLWHCARPHTSLHPWRRGSENSKMKQPSAVPRQRKEPLTGVDHSARSARPVQSWRRVQAAALEFNVALSPVAGGCTWSSISDLR